MIKVVICDDHPLINQGLKSYLDLHAEIQVVAIASSVNELRGLLSNEIDVVLLDIQLPDGNGMDMCKEIKRQFTDIKVLGLSNLEGNHIILSMIERGASGYLLKSSPMEDIEKAILHIYDGGLYLDKEVQSSLISSKTNREDIPKVTRREKEVLHYLAQGMSSVQIAEKIFVSPLTVDAHRRNLLQKFNVNKTVALLRKAKDLGWDQKLKSD